MPYKTEKRLYVNADRSKIVEEDSEEAAFLLAGAGHELSDEDATRYGLTEAKAKAPAENKAKTAAPANKGK